MEPPVVQPPRVTTGNDKIWSILSHLSFCFGMGLILPLVVYLAMRSESEYTAANAREALNFHLSLIIYGICCIPLCIFLIGFPLIWALGLGSVVLAIIAAVKASEGSCFHYPLTLRLVK